LALTQRLRLRASDAQPRRDVMVDVARGALMEMRAPRCFLGRFFSAYPFATVMAGLDPAIHVIGSEGRFLEIEKGGDARTQCGA